MRYKASLLRSAPLLLCLLAACIHHSPEDRVLRAFAESFSGGGQLVFEHRPEFVRFLDSRSEKAWRRILGTDSYHLLLAAADSPVYCPDLNVAGNHGYVLGLTAPFVSRDSAVVALWQECVAIAPTRCPNGPCNFLGGNTIRFETDYLLLRTKRGWRLDRAVGGGAIMKS